MRSAVEQSNKLPLITLQLSPLLRNDERSCLLGLRQNHLRGPFRGPSGLKGPITGCLHEVQKPPGQAFWPNGKGFGFLTLPLLFVFPAPLLRRFRSRFVFYRHRSDGGSRFILVGAIRSQMTWFLTMPANTRCFDIMIGASRSQMTWFLTMPANTRCFDIIISHLSLAFLASFLGARRLRNSSFQGLVFVRPP